MGLEIAFENPKLAVALPGGLTFAKLRRLSLRLADAEAVSLGVEILECIESPALQKVDIEGGIFSATFMQALCRIAIMTSGKLVGLKLLWGPDGRRPTDVSEEVATALATLLEATPALEDLTVGIPAKLRGLGFARRLSPLQPPAVANPGTQPLLLNAAALVSLQHLYFDFLSDDVLVCLRDVSDRCLNIRRASFSGIKRHIEEPEEAMFLLLLKLGDCLEEFTLLIEMETEMRQYMQGILRTRIGALPAQWRGRAALKSINVNCVAFDQEGMRCIMENCPNLHTLLLDRAEYWEDNVVFDLVDNLFYVQHFRLRASLMLSDRALYSLGEVAFRFVTLELEPSALMSMYAIDTLRQKISPGSQPLTSNLMDLITQTSNAGAVSLIAAASGQPDPYAPRQQAPAPVLPPHLRHRRQPQLIMLKAEDEEEEELAKAAEQLMSGKGQSGPRDIHLGWYESAALRPFHGQFARRVQPTNA
eukprot:gnl/TRDRNA2_/TRDRNA2_68916_c0_seq1.p1 gnl/TRDRNA2_/TRDRNA2_68916_c0~~gnl/TRDRNA2_/TRDRNA2_68916_c0_seq1.p1  ORF type:complete len:501 (-),score=92.61 gnl/TRDRNA2_/TRDRNA2_68916_c0_seq1:52-1479(-)